MKTMKVILFVKSDKKDEKGKLAVYAKIHLNQSITTFSTGLNADPIRWKITNQYRKTRELKELKIRNELDVIVKELFEIHTKLRSKNINFSVNKIKEIYQSGDCENLGDQLMLSDLFDQHHRIYAPMVKTGNKAPETLRKYMTLRNHVYEFMKINYGLVDIGLNSLNFEFIDSFDAFLRSTKLIANNTTVKYVQSFRSIIRMAIKYEWLAKDPFILYDKKIKKKDALYLTKSELARIENVELPSERLRIVRDIFVFSCYTGYAPVDLFKLTQNNINIGNDGSRWIITERQKTGIKSDVPLLPKAEEIIAKYKEHTECILKKLLVPHRSNQKMNQYLKEVTSFAMVNKNCTQYISRHTFATTVILANGLSMEVLSKMLGHTNLKQTAHYGKIQNFRVGEEMQILREKMNDEYNK